MNLFLLIVCCATGVITDDYRPNPAAATDSAWGHCQCCQRTWNQVRPHFTTVWKDETPFSGRVRVAEEALAAMCIDCHPKHKPAYRLRYYRQVFAKTSGKATWTDVRRAVLGER